MLEIFALQVASLYKRFCKKAFLRFGKKKLDGSLVSNFPAGYLAAIFAFSESGGLLYNLPADCEANI